jgi:hypothetical protein
MLILLGVLLFIVVYGSYRCIKERSLSFFRWFGSLATYTFFKADKKVSIVLWGTVVSTLIVPRVVGPINVNATPLNMLSHFLFGFLSRELIKNANDYYPFVDKFASRFPPRIAKFITPSTFALALCLGNGIQEEIQKTIPALRSLVWTDLPDQLRDMLMDVAGITLSAKKTALYTVLRRRPA